MDASRVTPQEALSASQVSCLWPPHVCIVRVGAWLAKLQRSPSVQVYLARCVSCTASHIEPPVQCRRMCQASCDVSVCFISTSENLRAIRRQTPCKRVEQIACHRSSAAVW
jgi:hypothetical protein